MHKSTDEILDFLNRRFSTDCHWMDGNCFWLAFILVQRFTFLEIYYLPITGHFVALDIDDLVYYDFEGAHNVSDLDEPFLSWDSIKKTDIKYYQQLLRDCVF